jgi:hypothetical protein|eukprot:CAMPEP_0169068954 /NCGR_PEP_ID=MMETSP1015-20121227/4308_1 /TAXON_ID=342587 /ORGANISM="Karlodinium micrum, Strain CCMP2283" /LENGTH=710 /DNA_ID=CAMNT_0009127821 /DNA_START=49 /DNA_END=2181 /DNA_ORIENTATION=-
MAAWCQEDDYDMGYKTDTSDEETIYQASLRSHPFWYQGMVNAQMPAYGAQVTCQNIVQLGSIGAFDQSMQGYEWCPHSDDALQAMQAPNIEFAQDADSLMPVMGAMVLESPARSTGAELTRTQRRRAERRRAEQRRRLQLATSHFQEDEMSTPQVPNATTPTALVSGAGDAEITRTQRRRLQRRRAEQRLQMEMHQKYKEGQIEADGTISAYFADQTESHKQSRVQERRRSGTCVAAQSERRRTGEHHENLAIDNKCTFQVIETSLPLTHTSSDASSTCARSSSSLCSILYSAETSPTPSELDDVHEEGDDDKSSADDSKKACLPSRNRFDGRAQSLTEVETVQRMKSLLNKLTFERFATLSKQLISCGTRSTANLEILIREIISKASAQHHSIDMYADLCSMLHAHVSNESRDDSSMNVKKVLLNACQDSFESHLTTLASLQTEEEANQLDKSQMIGTLKFIGAILLRKMLASKVMFYIFEELIGLSHLSEALECLVTLLRVVGPSFDHSHREGLSEIFDQVAAFASDHMIRPRVRWLLKDVLELRACGWQDSKTKRIDSSSSLEEVAQKFDDVDDCFDKATMQKELASTFGDLLLSQNMQKAVARIAAINVPPQLQAEQLCDLLQFMAEMNVETVRALGFKFIVAIFTGSHWMPSAFEDGFRNFTRLCGEGRIKAPALAKVIQDEMIPAFRPLVNRGMLSSPFPRIYS